MQVAYPSSPPANEEHLTEMSMKLSEDFTKKLGFTEEGEEEIRKLERSWSKLEDSVEFDEEEEAGDVDDEEEEEEEEEFSFACVNAEGSPITAEEAFEDGQIRPVFPLFNRDLLFHYENADQNDGVSATDDNEGIRPRLRKVFVEDRDGDGEGKKAEEGSLGPHCSWSSGTVAEASASPETCRKSNSTGFSKLWRFRDLVLRSNSDGRDAFVFLNGNGVGDKTQSSSSRAAKLTSEEEKKSTKTKKGKEKTTSSAEKKKTKSAHEKLYMRNRALKEEVKHRSYLPYKQVGFFTNVNGLSRNIHPF
ncbi:hypothetical protein Bca4012_062456 [Brassica carinata]|uniref:Uncharacterized protein n=1 Tax=Brassica carinata TaxID=52824 RepID=A0A8X7SCY7_BRACI|nr:hypothetical protein Bca52824_032353 [Brassica carinata]